jgi:hypothetical protein
MLGLPSLWEAALSSGWKGYAALEGDDLVSVLLDMGMADTAVHPHFPTLVLARVPLRAPGHDGLESDEEFDLFEDLFDALDDMALHSGALLVARRTWRGVREHVFYAGDGVDLEDGVRRVMLGYPEHVFEIEAREDAGWTFFLDTIYPSAIDLRIMDDDHLCDCLRDQGDDLVTPRRIDHRAYFGDEVSRQRFIKLVRSSGYDIAGLLDPGGASEEYGVTFSAMGAPSDISSIVAPLYGAARNLGGRYDGWETEVVVRPGPHN